MRGLLLAMVVGCGGGVQGKPPGSADAQMEGPSTGSAPPCTGQFTWTDVTSTQIAALGGMAAQSYPGGVSGVVVNRLTGDLTAHLVGFGLWRSTDRGSTWTRLDQMTLDTSGGRSENGWGIQVDQDDPKRIAVFTLDGTAGYTADGITWHAWADSGWGRNWDFGAVDWSFSSAQTVFGVLHETTPRNLYEISTTGGGAWSAMDTGKVSPMVGVIDAQTLIATRTTGIERSTDLGASWSSVSTVTPSGHVAVRFDGKLYVTTPTGLFVSDDQGQTWAPQGVGIEGLIMFQGPFFGADDNTMVVGVQDSDNSFGTTGSSIYKTTDGGATWNKVVDMPSVSGGFPISLSWYGSFAWDPGSDTYYVSSMSNPLLRLDCSP
jgi:BNR/Asp-box repeat